MKIRLIQDVQLYIARSSVTASAARGQGASGVVESAREFLGTLSLRGFGTRDERAFQRAIDRQTVRLVQALPARGRSWGLARKLLNIFLRNALYTSYLRDTYGLGAAERWFEVPLDGVIARRVRIEMPGSALPRWRGVRHVTPELSREYQEVCRQLAKQRGCAPVHLDAVFWGGR